MNKAEQILEKHINADDLNFIFHDKKDLWQELLNAVNEALRQNPVSGRSEQLLAFAQWHAKEPFTREEHQDLGKRIERYLSQ